MATTTPNYGWTVPTSSDLVKDGATAIETLGDAIDASMNTALGTKKAGMVLLNTTSFSGVSSVSLPTDSFTSAYEDYRILVRFSTQTSGDSHRIRMRTAGTDNTGSIYRSNLIGMSDSATTVSGEYEATTSMRVGPGYDGQMTTIVFDIFKPQLAVFTNLIGNSTRYTGSAFVTNTWWGNIPATTVFDSLTLFKGAGNITGKVSCYGYSL